MAVTLNTINFAGFNSGNFGIYISGEGVYNSPARSVETVSVPGRNGDVLIDQGKFENISVTYPAFAFADSQDEFREILSAYRNAIMSVFPTNNNYQNLVDTYHPNEYRQAVYISGLEADPVMYGRAATFSLTFLCKPQRFLNSGNTETVVTSGDTLTNPTRFAAKPFLRVNGYGQITIGNRSIRLVNDTLGEITLLYGKNVSSYSKTYDASMVSSGDDIYVGASTFYFDVAFNGSVTNIGTPSESGTSTGKTIVAKTSDNSIRIAVTVDGVAFIHGTAQTLTHTSTVSVTAGGTTFSLAAVMTFIITAAGKITITRELNSGNYTVSFPAYYVGDITADSSASALGTPTYIDCETGKAYFFNANRKEVSASGSLIVDSDLPILPANSSVTITCGENITTLGITPRWWEL